METKDPRLKFIEWTCWAFFALCALAIARWLILAFVFWAGWGVPDWAAWFQAVGSIAAIFGAFEIARRQSERDRAQATAVKDEKRANALLKAVMQGVHIRKVLTDFDRFLSTQSTLPNIFKFQEERLAAVLRGLEAVPFGDLHAVDAHSIAKITIMVVELYSGIASHTGAHSIASMRETIGKFEKSIRAEMALLAASYQALVGTYPLP